MRVSTAAVAIYAGGMFRPLLMRLLSAIFAFVTVSAVAQPSTQPGALPYRETAGTAAIL